MKISHIIAMPKRIVLGLIYIISLNSHYDIDTAVKRFNILTLRKLKNGYMGNF